MSGLTFSEEEHRKLVDYFNFVANKAEFKISARESSQFAMMQIDFKHHLDKIKDNIFEVKKVTQAAPAVEENK